MTHAPDPISGSLGSADPQPVRKESRAGWKQKGQRAAIKNKKESLCQRTTYLNDLPKLRPKSKEQKE